MPPSLLVVTPQVFVSPEERQSIVFPKVEVKPKITARLAAGTISDIVVEKISLKDHKLRIDIVRTSIKADGCLTGLTLRSYVIVTFTDNVPTSGFSGRSGGRAGVSCGSRRRLRYRHLPRRGRQ
ncbi:MspA family porin [Nocardia sputi]|uniref:MspA family porin n=1 Tax=Nocardia TaxID=1817 RepID=UPI001CBEAB22